jgi:cytochrome P450
VLISPNRLSLDGAVGWPEVFGHRSGGQSEFSKEPGFPSPGVEVSIIGAPRDVHRRQRRQLGHAFSETAMYEQEPIIDRYTDKLIAQLTARAQRGELVDIVKWLNFTTFDIIGDLAFADSFHSLDSSEYHPWVLTIFDSIRGSAMHRFPSAIPILRPVVAIMMGTKSLEKLAEHNLFVANKARERMDLGAEPLGRRDFKTYMMRKNRDGEVGLTNHEIEVNSSILIVAGSETTATALSGFFFYLSLKHQKCTKL